MLLLAAASAVAEAPVATPAIAAGREELAREPQTTRRSLSDAERRSLAASWDSYSPNPYLNVPLAGVAGGLYRVYVVLALALFLVPPLLAPWCGRSAGEAESSRHPALTAARALGLVAVAAAALWFSYGTTIDLRTITEEHELPILFADHCAQGRGCPLAGQQISSAGVHLGPLYFVILTVGRSLSHDLDVLFGLILGLHAITAVLTVLLANRLYGRPWGYLAGLLVAFCPSLTRMFLYLTHVNFVPLPMIGLIGGLLYQARDGGDRPFLVAAASLAAATQLHAITAIYLPALLLIALCSHPRPSLRGWLAGVAVWLLLYAPWIVYNAELDFRDFGRGTLAGWPGASQPLLEGWFLSPSLLIGIPLVILGIDAVGRRNARADRTVARALLLLFVSPLVAFLVIPTWRWQYTAPSLLTLAFAWTHALRAPLTWMRRSAPAAFDRSALLAMGICAVMAGILIQEKPPRPEPSGPAVWREERAMVRSLERRGLGSDEIATRVAGLGWPGRTANPAILVERSAPPPRLLTPREHVLVVEHCLQLPPGFGSWQEVIEPLGRPYLLSGYGSELTPVTARLVAGQTLLWSGTPSLPISAPTSRDTIRHALEGTSLDSDSLGTWLLSSWLRFSEIELELRTALLPAGEDRVVVVAHDPATTVSVDIDGSAATPIETVLDGNETQHERFSVDARRRSVEVPIVVRARRTAASFPFIHLYEEPQPRCVRPRTGPLRTGAAEEHAP